jgi:hypothetical protein
MVGPGATVTGGDVDVGRADVIEVEGSVLVVEGASDVGVAVELVLAGSGPAESAPPSLVAIMIPSRATITPAIVPRTPQRVSRSVLDHPDTSMSAFRLTLFGPAVADGRGRC